MPSIDEVTKTRFLNDKHRFVLNLMYTSNYIRSLFEEQLKPFGLTNPQFNILRILRGAGDWKTMGDVKELMVEKSPNTTRLVDKLLDKGLIKRERDVNDRRVVYIKITKKGLNVLKKIDEIEQGDHIDIFNRITEKEAKKASEIIDKLRG